MVTESRKKVVRFLRMACLEARCSNKYAATIWIGAAYGAAIMAGDLENPYLEKKIYPIEQLIKSYLDT